MCAHLLCTPFKTTTLTTQPLLSTLLLPVPVLSDSFLGRQNSQKFNSRNEMWSSGRLAGVGVYGHHSRIIYCLSTNAFFGTRDDDGLGFRLRSCLFSPVFTDARFGRVRSSSFHSNSYISTPYTHLVATLSSSRYSPLSTTSLPSHYSTYLSNLLPSPASLFVSIPLSSCIIDHSNISLSFRLFSMHCRHRPFVISLLQPPLSPFFLSLRRCFLCFLGLGLGRVGIISIPVFWFGVFLCVVRCWGFGWG